MRKIVVLSCYVLRYFQLMLVWIVLHTFKRKVLNQNIWLICEKYNEARDNGYHFFKYLKEKHPEYNVFYVIKSTSPDYHKIARYEDIIEPNGWKHCLYFLASKYSVSSQPYGAYPFSFSVRMLNYVKILCNKAQKVVFLQHGITQNKIPVKEFSYAECNIDYFVTSTPREYEFVKETYKYPKNAIGCVGLARFDYLYTEHILENKILIMPTWRRWLDGCKLNDFYNSDYFIAYANLLNDQELIRFLKNNNFKAVFYLHHKLQPYVNCFKMLENDVVIIANDKKFDVQELLMTSKFLITDFSSVFFDFTYMDKPLVYYQFDKVRFRNNHFEEGYFSYDDDGFGPCIEDSKQLKDYIVEVINNKCCQPQKYGMRAKVFFCVRNMNNCERIYNEIKSLG